MHALCCALNLSTIYRILDDVSGSPIDIKLTPNRRNALILEVMSEGEMMDVDEVEIVPTKNISKGKGKTVETADVNDNLPW